jgi:chaperonin GroES
MTDFSVLDDEDAEELPAGEETEERLWERIEDLATGENVADLIAPKMLDDLARLVFEGFEIDKDSRKEWETIAKDGLKILAAAKERKNTPFEGASNIHFPLLADALVQFWARCCSAILGDKLVVKGDVVGPDKSGAKRKRADRIAEHMSYQKTDASTTWVEDTRSLIMQVGAIGHAFRKCYWRRDNNNAEADFCSALDVYVNNETSSLEDCPRITHRHPLYPYEVETRMRDGRFRQVELAKDADTQRQKPYHFLEQMLRYDMDGDGYDEPWIVTVEEQTREVVKVLANFRPEDVKRELEPVPMPMANPLTGGPLMDAEGEPVTQMQELPIGRVLQVEGADYWVDFGLIPDPAGTYYKQGLAKLLANIQDAIDTALNQLTDAATLQNSGGGFIGANLNLNERGGVIRRKPGVYQVLNAAGQDIRNAIYNFEDPGPSQALYNLFVFLVDTGKGSAMLTEVLTGEAPTQQPATTTIALIEQGLQVFGEIFRGLWESMRKEFRLQAKLNQRYLKDDAYRMVVDDPTATVAADYAMADCDVRPVADPRQVTNMQKMGRAQFLQAYRGQPGINTPEVDRRTFEAVGLEDIDKLIAPPPEPPPEVVMKARAEVLKLLAEVAEKMTNAFANVAKGEAEEAGANAMEYAGIMQLASNLLMLTNPQLGMMMNGQDPNAPAASKPGAMGGMAPPPGMGLAQGGPPGQRGGAAPGVDPAKLGAGAGGPNGSYGASGGGGSAGPAF